MVLLVSSVSAFDIDSNIYEAYNYHIGLSGGIGESINYSIRNTVEFQQGVTNVGESTDYIIKVGIYRTIESNAPALILVSPIDNFTYTTSNNIVFVYNVTDNSEIDYCTLYILDIPVLNDTLITNGQNTFTRTLTNDNYNWSISCVDEWGNENTSNIYNIFVDVAGAQSSGGGSTARKVEEALDINELVDEVILSKAKAIRSQNRNILFFLMSIYMGWLLFAYKRDDEDKKRKMKRKVSLR